MNKFDFMQDMLTRAYNRHRRDMGLGPVSAAQMECSSTHEPAESPEQPAVAPESKQEDE